MRPKGFWDLYSILHGPNPDESVEIAGSDETIREPGGGTGNRLADNRRRTTRHHRIKWCRKVVAIPYDNRALAPNQRQHLFS